MFFLYGCFDDKGNYDYTGIPEVKVLGYIMTDARKEFIGEGQSFYLFKRLNLPVFDGLQNVDFRNLYTLPVPKSEEVVF